MKEQVFHMSSIIMENLIKVSATEINVRYIYIIEKEEFVEISPDNL